jgi:hypothetical protein
MRPALRSGVTLNCCRLGRVSKLSSYPLATTLFASLRGSLHLRIALLFLSSCVYYSANLSVRQLLL